MGAEIAGVDLIEDSDGRLTVLEVNHGVEFSGFQSVWGDRIDLMLPAIAYQRVALDRAIDHVITAEDVIIHKLIAWRALHAR